MPTPTKITHEQVLQGAIAIVDQLGAEGLSIRELARSLGVKAPSLYRYFPDKAGIELAVVDYGNRRLLECLKAAAGLARPGDEWNAVGEVYVAFARARPNLYRLMMEGRPVSPPGSESCRELWEFLLRLAGGGADGGLGDRWRAVALWSFLHGFVSLDGAGRFGAGEPGANGLGASGRVDAFAAGLKAIRKGLQGRLET